MNTAWVETTDKGWVIGNGRIRMELAKSPGGGVTLASLARPAAAGEKDGFEWALRGSPIGPATQWDKGGGARLPEEAGFRYSSETVSELPDGSAVLSIAFADTRRGAALTLNLKCFPGRAAIEFDAALENRGNVTLPLVYALWPLCLSIGRQGLRVSNADPKGRHGFFDAGPVEGERAFDNWIVAEDGGAHESLLVGGDLGAGILGFGIVARAAPGALGVRAGAILRQPKEGEASAIELAPGHSARTPLSFLALAHGGPDEAANEAFRYLKKHVLPEPIESSPLATSCVWISDPDAEEILLEELAFARRTGFDVFYHDASWVEGSSIVPGMNDWALGLGTYKESRQKFPHGLAELSRKVRAAGMKFGLWVDPGMVDAARVAAGEFPRKWLALRGGKALECHHPSLSVMTQLCLGNPDVVAWIKKELAGIIERYGLEWMKWDTSGTVNHACDRADHGHGAHGGAWASYEGMMEVWSFLLEKFPRLSGFECDPSLRHCRLNPGPRTLMPGGYRNEFMTGPMVGPYVTGSLATTQTTDSVEIKQLTAGWCSASTLDYSMRQHLVGGISFGNINGMWSQFLSRAPSGYIEAFKRNLLHFKSYRHLLFADVWHPPLASPEGWSALQYAREDASEAILFVFRHPGGGPKNVVKPKALDPARTYVLTSLNDRPGRDRRVTGASLLSEGIDFALPDPWLAKGDGGIGPEYDAQLAFGSDIVLIREASK